MGIHKEGFKTIIISFFALSILVWIVNASLPHFPFITITFGFLALLFWLAIISFFRYPKFSVVENLSQVISPADGKVVVIEKVKMNEFLEDERIQISIFMSPANTHMNRYPISGNIAYYRYHPGKHLVAWLPKASTDNERATVAIENSNLTIMVRQIAGAVARRIVCYSKEGQEVRQGDQLGFIKFGSRVDVFLPLDAEIQVSLEEKVRAGKTILAKV
ncbi:MAG: phosphatidylserine decarboxylase family protein [Bacteroidales bacterium]|nr:phosphatidylserine decarboxylase family protein [Bacteroidales bacterium]